MATLICLSLLIMVHLLLSLVAVGRASRAWNSIVGSSTDPSSGSSNSGSVKASGRVDIKPEVKELLANVISPKGYVTVKYMDEPMDDLLHRIVIGNNRYKENAHGVVYKHDYFEFGYSRGDQMVWIKAEKGGNTEKGVADAGVSIDVMNDQTTGNVRYELRDFTLGEGREAWTVGKVVDILASHQPVNYHLLKANCWHFAFTSTESVLKWFSSNVVDESKKAELEKELAKLKVVERIMPSVLFHIFLHPRHPESIPHARQFQCKLAHTKANLPESSTWRHKFCALLLWFVDNWFNLNHTSE